MKKKTLFLVKLLVNPISFGPMAFAHLVFTSLQSICTRLISSTSCIHVTWNGLCWVLTIDDYYVYYIRMEELNRLPILQNPKFELKVVIYADVGSNNVNNNMLRFKVLNALRRIVQIIIIINGQCENYYRVTVYLHALDQFYTII